MAQCLLCPRSCNVDRDVKKGVCQVPNELIVALARLHYWEEPCISGNKGSGAVFFSGCPLHCIFCQNQDISKGEKGQIISVNRLAEIFFELEEKGANNINLVTGSQYIPKIAEAIAIAKNKGLCIPFVFNTSGYEKVESLRLLDGLIDVYLPDFKYMDDDLARQFSSAGDYPAVAKAALKEMFRQQPQLKFDENGMITKGIIVRQLLLPGHVKDAKAVTKYLYSNYKDFIYISLMSQYTPMNDNFKYPELNRRVTKREYKSFIDYALSLGITNAFIQDRKVAEESFIPEFNGEGI